MVTLEQRIQAFVKLGDYLRAYLHRNSDDQTSFSASLDLDELNAVLDVVKLKNGWFTQENLLFAISNWEKLLTYKALQDWGSHYSISEKGPKDIAIIMAGNIPLVGFHDLLSVLLTGNRALVKLSSSDSDLMPFLIKRLVEFEPEFKGYVHFTEGLLKGYDAVIATGSDNTARYFEYYFGHKPNIIRKNRNSVAILTGTETDEDLKSLGEDIFRYFGLGCRSVSKVFVPMGYDFDRFYKAMSSFEYLKDHHKYHNNYDYNKAVYLMSEFPFLDNGFLILKEDHNYASPIATVHYESYDSKGSLSSKLKSDADSIQCLVAKGFDEQEIPFGLTQLPSLRDYADGVDTVEFLLKT
jgi:hypothetical protein